MTAADTASSPEQQGEGEEQRPVASTGQENDQETSDKQKTETGRIIPINDQVAWQEKKKQDFVTAFMKEIHAPIPLALTASKVPMLSLPDDGPPLVILKIKPSRMLPPLDKAPPLLPLTRRKPSVLPPLVESKKPGLAERARTNGKRYSRHDILLMLAAITIGNEVVLDADHLKRHKMQRSVFTQEKRGFTLFAFSGEKKEIVCRTYGYGHVYNRACAQALVQGHADITEADALNHALEWLQETDPTFTHRPDKACFKMAMQEELTKAARYGVILDDAVENVLGVDKGKRKKQTDEPKQMDKFIAAMKMFVGVKPSPESEHEKRQIAQVEKVYGFIVDDVAQHYAFHRNNRERLEQEKAAREKMTLKPL